MLAYTMSHSPESAVPTSTNRNGRWYLDSRKTLLVGGAGQQRLKACQKPQTQQSGS